MMSIKDWVVSQLVSNSLASARPLSGSDSFFEERPSNDFNIHGSTQTTTSPPPEAAADVAQPPISTQEPPRHSPLRHPTFETSDQPQIHQKKSNPLQNIEKLQIKFLRVLHRLNHSTNDLMVAKVLYRIHLATLIRTQESDLKKVNLNSDKAKSIAIQQETSGQPELDFSLSILVLGKTGVGKSSTINSILNELKARTNAFRPSTEHVDHISGVVNGIKITFIDTPGLLPLSPNTIGRNRKILQKIKRRCRKYPPDMVLYFERLDVINTGYSDFPLLKLVTEVFGSGIWFNTMLVMTHASSPLPEGTSGYPVTYESYLTQCTNLLQHYIHQAVSDSKLETPVLFVENHPNCKDKILPNGQNWKSQFLLSCLCTKILSDVNKILDFHDRMELGIPGNPRIPSLPHLLSSFLKHRIQTPNGDEIKNLNLSLSDLEEDEQEYDSLPPIRILTKSQFKKLTNSQKNDYLDELDYRETLYLKKQLKEELVREKKDEAGPPEPVVLPDMAVPPSFDSVDPVNRYRCLVNSDRWLTRPVLDPHGWDHDVGFDGINLEGQTQVNENLNGTITGQVSKDKREFNVQSACCLGYVDQRGLTYGGEVDVQSSGSEMVYTVHGNVKGNLGRNVAECGVSVMSFGGDLYSGVKIEDGFWVGKRVKVVVNGGRMGGGGGGGGRVVNGGSLEVVVRGRDFPVRNDKVSCMVTVLSMGKEMVVGGNVEAEVRVGRGTNLSFNGSLNNRNMGQVCVKVSSCERMEIGLIAVVSILRVVLRRMGVGGSDKDMLQSSDDVR